LAEIFERQIGGGAEKLEEHRAGAHISALCRRDEEPGALGNPDGRFRRDPCFDVGPQRGGPGVDAALLGPQVGRVVEAGKIAHSGRLQNRGTRAAARRGAGMSLMSQGARSRPIPGFEPAERRLKNEWFSQYMERALPLQHDRHWRCP
jgi:hypothetical protein